MSYHPADEAACSDAPGSVALMIQPRERDLGEFTVRRVLPARQRRAVGPFVFFDHMGPAEFPPGQSINVRPHPHIGIATITYLFEGEILHRDSLGVVQPIHPGAVNLMTAGRGIVHSERPGSDVDQVSRLHGIQSWIALPLDLEETEPAFAHTAADALPEIALAGATVRVIMGTAFGQRSPVTTYSDTLYLDCDVAADACLELPAGPEALAIYVVQGEIAVAGATVHAGTMAVAEPGQGLKIFAQQHSRVMVIGGDSLGERHLDWNFVSSDPQRIVTAREDWAQQRFPPVPDENEFIPLPN